jgi:predicted short-subunit dehydrogenase-like oxidoreductase (DUF2520 family)
MPGKPRITIIGPGRLGTALVLALHGAGYPIDEIVLRPGSSSAARVRRMAHKVGARAATFGHAQLAADVVWICVPDDLIASTARGLASSAAWSGKVVLHSSGALGSDELAMLSERGARTASLHPMMSFVHNVVPDMAGVWFAVEGDAPAARLGRRIARDLGGHVISIARADKALYHAWGAFACPLVVANLTLAENIAGALGVPEAAARKTMAPMLRQTLENYIAHGAAASFSGPLVRGDVATIRRHLQALSKLPVARDAYVALARAALLNLPVRNRGELEKVLKEK